MARITEFRYCSAQHIPIADEVVDDLAEEDATTGLTNGGLATEDTPATLTIGGAVVPEKKPVCGKHIIDGLEFDFSALVGNFRSTSWN